MSSRDPANAEYYADNYAKFSALIDEFDAAMRDVVRHRSRSASCSPTTTRTPTSPRTYGWTVIGAIQVVGLRGPDAARGRRPHRPGESRSGVPAIFGSEVFPSPVLEQIGRETGVEYVDELRDDDLPGEPGDAEHSWLGLMRFDYITMTEALGGDASALEAVEVRNVAAGRGRATRNERPAARWSASTGSRAPTTARRCSATSIWSSTRVSSPGSSGRRGRARPRC